MKITRLETMEKYIMAREKATMTELCDHFGISMNTARTDVA